MEMERHYVKFFKIKYPNTYTTAKKLRPSITFNSNNVKCQRCLPAPLLSYILKSANAAVLLKLQKSCKYFYLLHPIHLCKNIFVNTITEFHIDPESVYLPSNDTKSPRLKNIYLTDQLACYDEQWPDEKINRKFVSSLISQLYKCDVVSLYIPHQDLTLKEFEFLISSGKVKNFDMQDTVVVDENGKKLPHVRIQMALYKHRRQLESCAKFW